MLVLNALSWTVRGKTLASPHPPPLPWRATMLLRNSSALLNYTSELRAGEEGLVVNDGLASALNVLAYCVLALSSLLIITFAAFFVIFVVCRGALDQKRREDAQDRMDDEDALVALLRAHRDKCRARRIITRWREITAPSGADGPSANRVVEVPVGDLVGEAVGGAVGERHTSIAEQSDDIKIQ